MSLYHQIRLDSPVGYWPMDEASGTTAFDRSGNGRNLTHVGSTVGATARGLFRYPDFDGVDDEATAAAAVAFDTLHTGSFTMAAFINKDGPGETAGRIFNRRNSTEDGAGFIFFVNNLSADSVGVQVPCATTNASSRSTGGDAPSNRWLHVAATYSHTGDRLVRIYINGVEVVYSEQIASVGSSTLTSGVLRIGGNTDGIRNFDGAIVHAALFPSVLSINRIKAHYEAGIRSGVVV